MTLPPSREPMPRVWGVGLSTNTLHKDHASNRSVCQAEDHGGHVVRHEGVEDRRCNINRETSSATTAMEGTFMGGGETCVPAEGLARALQDRYHIVVDFVQSPTTRYRLRVSIASVSVPVYVELVSGFGNAVYYRS